MHPDDERLAKASKTLRRRQCLRQIELVGPRRSRRFVMRVEGARAGELRMDDLRSHFESLGARRCMTIWFNGAAIDRLLDERHASIMEQAIGVLRSYAWLTDAEVIFSVYGERGSIDIFAGHERARAVFVGEVKSDFGSLEETNRLLDVKSRHAPALALGRFGWKPASVGCALILPEDWTLRRIVARHALTLDSVYPARGREVRHWLRHPTGRMRGLWFLSEVQSPAHGDGG